MADLCEGRKMSFKNQEVSSSSAVNTAGITEGPAALAVAQQIG